jgi:hypothetical protein
MQESDTYLAIIDEGQEKQAKCSSKGTGNFSALTNRCIKN